MGKDRKPFSTKLDRKLLKELRHLSVELERPLNDLIEEGIKMVLFKYGKEVSERKENRSA